MLVRKGNFRVGNIPNLRLPGTFGAFTDNDIGCEFVANGVRSKLVGFQGKLSALVLEGKDRGKIFSFYPQLKVSNIVRKN